MGHADTHDDIYTKKKKKKHLSSLSLIRRGKWNMNEDRQREKKETPSRAYLFLPDSFFFLSDATGRRNEMDDAWK
jgi:hypothetical protein